jgi:hypothetical protein
MKQLCAICGIRDATTKDHVPPKGIFAKPRPSNLITVPACHECNNFSSVLDESFMVNLGIHVSIVGGEGKRLFDQQVLPTLQHNTKLLNKTKEKFKPINLETSDGTVHEGFYAGEWDSEAHGKVIERTIRGLNYHHYGEILGLESTVKTHYFESLSKEMFEMSKNWAANSFGVGDVVYKYTSATNGDIRTSLWLFQFYGAHWAGGQTKTPLGSIDA